MTLDNPRPFIRNVLVILALGAVIGLLLSFTAMLMGRDRGVVFENTIGSVRDQVVVVYASGFDLATHKPAGAEGSGFFVSDSGLVVTNDHVIHGSVNLHVLLSDGRYYPAKVLGTNSSYDIAVLKVEAPKGVKFHPVKIYSGTLAVGERVFALGAPYDLPYTVTTGDISDLHRDFARIPADRYDDYIQSNANLNPGNSGGPLFDEFGRVIGISRMILETRNGDNTGISFFLPVNDLEYLISYLEKGKQIPIGYLGAVLKNVDTELADRAHLSSFVGSYVSEVVPDSPASLAGLKKGDTIVAYDGVSIGILQSGRLRRLISETPAGKPVTVIVKRAGKTVKLTVTIGTAPPQLPSTKPTEIK